MPSLDARSPSPLSFQNKRSAEVQSGVGGVSSGSISGLHSMPHLSRPATSPLVTVMPIASGEREIRRHHAASRPWGEELPPTWDDVKRGQLQLEATLKISVAHKVVDRFPPWWRPSVLSSLPLDTKRFDEQHERAVTKAANALRASQDKPLDLVQAEAYTDAVVSVRRGRLVGTRLGFAGELLSTNEMKARITAERTKHKSPKSRWKRGFVGALAKVVIDGAEPTRFNFDARAKGCDSKEIIDTDACVMKMLDIDWERALKHGIGEYIIACDDDGGVGEIQEIHEALRAHAWLVYSSFDYLASIGGAAGGGVWSISMNGFASFVKDARLADPGSTNCKQSHLDQLFILINSQQERASDSAPASMAASAATPSTRQHDASPPQLPSGDEAGKKSWGVVRAATKLTGSGGQRTFERHEWLQALVRIAIMRYVLPGERTVRQCADVSEALEMLLMDDIKETLPPELGQISNHFRTKYLYTSDVEVVLHKYDASLRSLFGAYVQDPKSADPGALNVGNRIKIEDFIELFKALTLQDKGEQATSNAFLLASPY